MFYRRNTDEDLRSLERRFASEPHDRALLKQINSVRKRAGMPPHQQTRLEIALDRQREMNYLSFMIMRDIMPLLNVILVGHLGNLRGGIEQTMEIRSDAMEDALHRRKPERWMRTLRNLPAWAVLADDEIALTKITPAKWAKHPRRTEISDNVRQQADANCRELLNILSRDSAFQRLAMIDVTEDPEAVDHLLDRIQTVLWNWDVCHEEVYRARLGDLPDPKFSQLFGDLWWAGL